MGLGRRVYSNVKPANDLQASTCAGSVNVECNATPRSMRIRMLSRTERIDEFHLAFRTRTAFTAVETETSRSLENTDSISTSIDVQLMSATSSVNLLLEPY